MEGIDMETIADTLEEAVDEEKAQDILRKRGKRGGSYKYQKETKQESQPTGRPHHIHVSEKTLAHRRAK